MKFIPKDHWGIHLWGFIHTITIIDYDKIDDNVLRNKHAIAVLHLLTFKTPTINPYNSCIFLLLSFSSYNTFYYMFLSGYSYNMTLV